MSDVDSMSAMRIGPRSERNPRLDEVDTILLLLVEPGARRVRRQRGTTHVVVVHSRAARHPGRASACCSACVAATVDSGPARRHPSLVSVGRRVMVRTVGVEEEMLLVDVRNGRPRSVSGQVLVRAERQPPPGGGGRGARRCRGRVPAAADRDAHGAGRRPRRPCAARCGGGAPRPSRRRRESRFERRRARHVAAARAPRRGEVGAVRVDGGPLPAAQRVEHLTCGCHVHVSVESDEEGVGRPRPHPRLAAVAARPQRQLALLERRGLRLCELPVPGAREVALVGADRPLRLARRRTTGSCARWC